MSDIDKKFREAQAKSNEYVQDKGSSALSWAKEHWYAPVGFVALVIALVIWG